MSLSEDQESPAAEERRRAQREKNARSRWMWASRTVAGLVLAAAVVVVYANGNVYYMTVTQSVFVNVALAVSFQLVFGYARLISLGHAAFFATGAYLTGVLVSRYGWSHYGAYLIAIAAACILAIILGWLTLRLEPLLLAIATLAFAEAVQSLLTKLTVTGGENGLAVPPISSHLVQPQTDYLVCVVILLVVLAATGAVVLSPLGKLLTAVGDDAVAARSLGIKTSRTLIFVFIFGSVLAALAGMMSAQTSKLITPDVASLDTSTLILAIVAVGGIRSMWGTLAAAIFLTLLPEVAAPLRQYNSLIFGAGILIIFRLSPNGLVAPLLRRIGGRL